MKEQNELAGKWKIDSSAHKKAQKKAKLRNLAKGNTNPNEKAAAEKKAGGPKLMGEGKKKGLWDNIHAKENVVSHQQNLVIRIIQRHLM